MKIAICMLVLLPLVYSAAIQERFILDSFSYFINTAAQTLEGYIGSPATEPLCETACGPVLHLIPYVDTIASFVGGTSSVCHTLCVKIVSLG